MSHPPTTIYNHHGPPFDERPAKSEPKSNAKPGSAHQQSPPGSAVTATGGGSHTVRVNINVVLVALQPEGGEIVTAKKSNDRQSGLIRQRAPRSVGSVAAGSGIVYVCFSSACTSSSASCRRRLCWRLAAIQINHTGMKLPLTLVSPGRPSRVVTSPRDGLPRETSSRVHCPAVIHSSILHPHPHPLIRRCQSLASAASPGSVTSDTILAVDFIASSPEPKAKTGKAQRQDRRQPP